MFPASRAENVSFPEDCLPPERSYESRDALFRSINTWAATRGYAFTTGKSTRGKSGRQTVTYACDRSCHPPSASIERQRKTATRGTGCEFSLLAKESLDKSTWTVRHRPDKRFSKHNHAPSQHPSAHPAHRKLGEEVVADLSRLSHAGIAPRDIRTYIRQNCDSLATQQDIYNGIAATRREVCEGQSSIHALASQLDKEGFWSRIQFGEDGRVTAVLFAHPDSLAYLQAYPDILLLDCTYKTNKHGMPLLDMIGVDACQRSFCIAFAFLSGETEDDFLWALDRLRSLYEHHSARLPSVILTDRCVACMDAVETSFPTSCSLLCRWHANKAVLRYCRPAFVRQDQPGSTDPATNDTVETSGWSEFYQFWHSIMGAPNEEEFKYQVSQFEKKYLPDYLEQVGYVQTFWLEQYKEKLVKAWVDQHAHFGNTATSRVEGIHALMKSHLRKSTLDLFEAWRAMKHALLNQLSELRSNQARQQIRLPIELSGPLYAAVHGWVSHEALRKVEEQRKLLSRKDPPPPLTCTGSFTRSHGLPCLHTLKSLQEQGQVLSLEHLHQHWRLQRKGAPQPLLEPRQRIESTFTHSNIPKQSTRREPSAFESVGMARKAPPTCSRCHTVGHTRTARACPMRFGELLQQEALGPGLSQSVEASDTEPEPPQIRPLVDVPEEESAPAPADGFLAAVLGDQPETVTVALQDSPCGASQQPGPLVHEPSLSPGPPPPSQPRYDSPQAIYGRYIAARSAWYAVQPAGSIKTNQQYRKAMGLPLRYDKQSYEWCLDYKQMSNRCTTSTGSRQWTKEEMMAYLDWTKAEDERIEAQVAEEMGDNPLANTRRGVKDIWGRIETDSREQEALHSASRKTDDCIIVGSHGC